jgi:glycosyltransferase involved in cell wall biosynthesis
MRVVIVGDYPREPNQISGGVEAVVLYLSQALQDFTDLKLDIVTVDRWGLGERTIAQDKVTVHYLAAARLPSRIATRANVNRMRDKIVSLEPDLVHAHIAGKYAYAAAKTGLPWVLTLHGIRFLETSLWQGFISKTYRGWFIKREELTAVRQASHIISISPFVRTTFDGQIRGKVYDIENPIAQHFFDVPEQGQPGRLLFVGRLIPRKGVHTLLQAFVKARQRIPVLTLRLAGGGLTANDPTSYYHTLQRTVDEGGLRDAVTFLGELDEAALLEEYAKCAGLVLSSVLETAPMVAMQAMAAGKAVVSTDAGGARYLVEPGQNGLVVPPDDPQTLAEAIYQVFSDESVWRKMGRRGKELAQQRFHAGVVADRTREVYYEILSQSPL